MFSLFDLFSYKFIKQQLGLLIIQFTITSKTYAYAE